MAREPKLTFWGTRGLISSPRPSTSIYGGNTTSIQIFHKDHIIVVDTGFGVSNLGEQLMQRILVLKQKLEVHIFFTHFHWDHIQGLPFFHPIYFPSTTLNLYSPMPNKYLWQHLDVLFDGSYSPFAGIDSMPANIVYHRLDGPMTIGDLSVQFCELNHNSNRSAAEEQKTFAYRFDDAAGSVVLATDHEAAGGSNNNAFVRFARGSDILVHDAQYTESEYQHRHGWGHSSISQALENARRIGPALTLLTHHSPLRDDVAIAHLERHYRRYGRSRGLKFCFAREGKKY